MVPALFLGSSDCYVHKTMSTLSRKRSHFFNFPLKSEGVWKRVMSVACKYLTPLTPTPNRKVFRNLHCKFKRLNSFSKWTFGKCVLKVVLGSQLPFAAIRLKVSFADFAVIGKFNLNVRFNSCDKLRHAPHLRESALTIYQTSRAVAPRSHVSGWNTSSTGVTATWLM